MIAAVDCGTNTIKLLIGSLPDVAVRESRTVRLGQGVDTTGELADEALARAFTALDEYAALIAARPVSEIRFCATSATRDASNAAVFSDGVLARLGVRPEVLSGEEEAALSYAGAARNLRVPVEPPVLVVDIGGGSTELVLGSWWGTDGPGPVAGESIDVGSVRLHERHLHSDPPSTEEILECVADVEGQLDRCGVDLASARTVVGVAGTITTIGAGVLDLPAYDAHAIDQSTPDVGAVRGFIERLLAMTVAERRALPYLAAGREDVIGAGALILDRVLLRTTVQRLVVSESDILDGIAWSMVKP